MFAESFPDGSGALLPTLDSKRRHNMAQLRRFSVLEVSGQCVRGDPEAYTDNLDEIRRFETLSFETSASSADADVKRTVFRSYADSVPKKSGQQFEVMRTL